MPLISVERLDDERLAPFRDMQGQSLRGESGDHFIVEGRYCVDQLRQSGWSIQSAIIQRGREEELASWFSPQTDVFVLSHSQIESLAGFAFHRGVLACGKRPRKKPLDELRLETQPPEIALAAIGISDRDNLGNMIRTAMALGIGHLICDRRFVDPLSRRVIRVSMGTVFSQSVFHCDDAVNVLPELARRKDYRLVATTLADDATPIEQFQMDHRPIVLMMGNESSGLDPRLQTAAHDRVTIPMKLATDSLNVSVATAIFMYELTRLSQSFRELHYPQGT